LELPAEASVSGFYLALVAICHQTQALRGTVNGVDLRGWDYLSARFAEFARRDPAWTYPIRWQQARESALDEVFRDQHLGSTLSNAAGRAALLRDLGNGHSLHGWKSPDELYAACAGRVAVGTPNLLAALASLRAYSDPVYKKSFFFLGLMANAGHWQYSDPEHVGAPIDYHEVRGHLRLGTVVVVDAELQAKLLAQAEVSEVEDVAIRSGVSEAVMLVAARIPAMSAMRLHYAFWNLFRSVCLRQGPFCRLCPDSLSLPARYLPLVTRGDDVRSCPFGEVCPSVDLAERYQEHRFTGEWY
jgi:hypothetical protein